MARFSFFARSRPRPAPAPRRTSIRRSKIIIIAAWCLLPAMPILGVVIGVLVMTARDQFGRAVPIGIAVVLVATCVALIYFLIEACTHSVTYLLAPLFMTRFGASDRARAEELLYEIAKQSTAIPEFRVVEGVLRDDLDEPPKEKTPEDGAKSAREIFKATRIGPAILYVDRESVVLLQYGEDKKNPKAGTLDVLHQGKQELKKGDRLKGIAHLRPQREEIDVKGVLTRDAVSLDFHVMMVYQIRQDQRHLERTQEHHADVRDVQCALLPRDEWRAHTKSLFKSQLSAVIGECELAQLFLAPAQPHLPAAMATLYTLGQSFLPLSTRAELEQRVKVRLNQGCWKAGVEVSRITFEEIQAPKEICDAAQRAYLAWTRMTEELMTAEKEAQSALRLAQVKLQQAQVDKETQFIKAQTHKDEIILAAEGEADAYARRMQARADAAQQFARQIQILRQALGTGLDGQAMRELLRALGFMEQENDTEQDLAFLSDLLARRARERRE